MRTLRWTCAALMASALASGVCAGDDFPVVVRGGSEQSFQPPPNASVVKDPDAYDAVVVGAGLAGLSAALYLTDHGKRVLVLEKESNLGGLASGSSDNRKVSYDRGGAYWTETYEEEQQILDRIGLGQYKQQFPIHEPADSYYWNGEMYLGIWDDETLKKLPASFALFHFMLKAADEKGQIPNQPMEEAQDLSLDETNAADWVRSMPALLREDLQHRKYGAAKLKLGAEILKRFDDDPKVNRDDPMGDVVGLLDLYCRSALGTTAEQVSAIAFANFYIDEIITRYTTPDGTAGAAERMEALLRKRPKLATLSTNSPVTKIRNFDDHVVVSYNHGADLHEARGSVAVFSAQLRLAPQLIEDFKGTEQADLMEQLPYAHYAVHNVFVEGHPYRATYDTWVRPKDYDPREFTDVILARWQDRKISGYEGVRALKAGADGAREFVKDPKDDDGIFTIYHPLPLDLVGRGFGDDEAKDLARGAVKRLLELWPPKEDGKALGTPVTVKSVETNRWPFSVHIAAPGHFKRVKIMRRTFKRVVFGNNNLGTPAFEEALFRGHCAADKAMKLLEPAFKFETWTQCPND